MPNVLKRATGKATILGATIYTAPVGAIVTIVGCRGANNDAAANHWITFDINGSLISGAQTPLPVGAALDIMAGSKIVAVAGDVIKAFADTDNQIDVYISYLEQT